MGENELGPGTGPPSTPARRRRGDQSPRALIDAVFPQRPQSPQSPADSLGPPRESAGDADDGPGAGEAAAGGGGESASGKHRAEAHRTVRTDPSAPHEARSGRAGPAADRGGSDLQVLAQRALHGACEALGLDLGLVLHRHGEGTDERPLASFARSGVPRPPERGELALLWRQTRATDLGDPSLSEIARLFSQRTGFTAVRALTRGAGPATPGLLLLVGGAGDPIGRVRPRTKARLDALAASLTAPLESDRTVSRISELDDAVKRLDRLALLGSLVAEVIHEVRNPLVSIKTFLELLPQRLDDPEFHGDFRGLVLDEVFRLERLLDEVLAHARPGPVRERPEDASVADSLAALEQLLTHRAREAGATLTAIPPEPDLPDAALSPDALRQVLLNLCVNAIEACGAGGEVRISARRRPRRSGADLVEIWVEDDGPGIPEADREFVFEPFHSGRSDSPGGLGLAISRRLTEEAGGRLFVAQTIEGGARFVLRVPMGGG